MDLTGLLGGVAEGLKAGFQGYDTERRYQDKKAEEAMERAIKERAYKLQLAQSGYEETPLGGYQQTAETKENKAFGRAKETADVLKGGYAFNNYNPVTGRYEVSETPEAKQGRELERKFKGSQITKAEADAIESRAKAKKAEAEAWSLKNPTADSKPVPAGEVMKLGSADAAVNALTDAANLKIPMSGPVQGRLGKAAAFFGMGGTSDSVKSYDAALKSNAQTIGVYLEGGKLTDADIERYRDMLPQITDSDAVKQNKIDLLTRKIQQRKMAEVIALQNAGYNAKGLMGAGTIVNLPRLDKKGFININPVQEANASNSGPHGNTIRQNGVDYTWNPKTMRYE